VGAFKQFGVNAVPFNQSVKPPTALVALDVEHLELAEQSRKMMAP
jgi:hypothetical protein